MKLDELVSEASKLSEEQRASMASQLLHSLETPHHWVSDEEVSERIREAEEDPSVLISLDEFTRGVQRNGG